MIDNKSKKNLTLFIIKEKDKFGFIDKNEKIIIKPEFNNDLYYNHYEGAVSFSD